MGSQLAGSQLAVGAATTCTVAPWHRCILWRQRKVSRQVNLEADKYGMKIDRGPDQFPSQDDELPIAMTTRVWDMSDMLEMLEMLDALEASARKVRNVSLAKQAC